MSTQFKVSVVEITQDHAESSAAHSFTRELFSQTFDEFNLRAFVQQLNQVPRRRRKTAKGETT